MGRKIPAQFTFASPRVGDDSFARDFDEFQAEISNGIAKSSDLVTEMPFAAPIADFVGGFFLYVDTPVVTAVELGGIEAYHRSKLGLTPRSVKSDRISSTYEDSGEQS